ncbi:hypothetical protein O181_114428 [Austropuccinia psidii MF-1]|uniref:Uncharacterized protein n=1 Tax=Austropuccinia psidii MF-1 TaxID=1389203 RepID=A0A9Q3PUJ4_9BASI|nr:hypothetical protein [Austropuccinia psidii MF-1]
MASSGHFDPSQTYDGSREVEILNHAFTECLAKDRRYLWSKKDGPFGKEFPVSEAPTADGASGSSQFAEGSDELDGEEVEVVPHSVGHPSSNSSAQPLSNRFQSQVIPSTPRTFQPVLASIPTTIPPSSPSTSHARPALNPAVKPSPSQKPRKSPITTSQQLKPVASSSRRRDGLSPLPFPADQVFQRRDCGLSELPEKIPMRRVKTKKLWPDYSAGLIGIAGS